MERELIVLLEDTKEKSSYGFMSMPTPSSYAKKAKKVMDVNNSELSILDKENNVIDSINCNDMKQVTISLCSRIVSSSGFGGGLATIVHIDMDIEMQNGKMYYFEVVRPDSFEVVFNKLKEYSVSLIDPINVQNIYVQMASAGPRSKYLSANFGKMARKHKLDHPRKS